MPVTQHKPVHLLLPQGNDDVLSDASLFIIVAFGVQVDGFPAQGDLHDQFRRPCQVLLCVIVHLPSMVWGDDQICVWLRFTFLSENCGGVVISFHPGCLILVLGKPVDDPDVHAPVTRLQGGRHVDNSSDQLSPGGRRHRLIALVERFLIETVSCFQRGGLLLALSNFRGGWGGPSVRNHLLSSSQSTNWNSFVSSSACA